MTTLINSFMRKYTPFTKIPRTNFIIESLSTIFKRVIKTFHLIEVFLLGFKAIFCGFLYFFHRAFGVEDERTEGFSNGRSDLQ